MSLDYKKLGFKAGLEIHQQLDTKKLFCECPCEIRDDPADRTVMRVLRASAGETGKMDAAAMAEMEKKKHFTYEYYDDTTCLVELDEEPPHDVNKEALEVVLTIARMMHCEIIDQVHVMRKTVVDGSNTSGFQRTALVARNGYIEYFFGGETKRVRIDTICLEEDAARIISRNAGHDVYRLDRLGIPLIEIATAPDIYDPAELKEAAAHIGMMLRSTGKVKRGLGTIRQDVNVSIEGGQRAEIKGVQDLRTINIVAENEILRQMRMLELSERMRSIKLDLASQVQNVDTFFSGTQSPMIKKNLDAGLSIYAKAYPRFKGFFGFEVNPGRRFGSELKDHITVLGLNGLIHTDENLDKYKITDDIKKIYDSWSLAQEDSLVLIIGDERRCTLAFAKIDEAIKAFYDHGISKEVRNAKEDGTSVFLRPMSSGSRMYPETDVRTIIPDTAHIKTPELIKDKVLRFEKQYSLPAQVAKELVFEDDFEMFVQKYPQVKPVTISDVLVSAPKDLKTRFNLDIDVGSQRFKDIVQQILERLNSGDLPKEAVIDVLSIFARGESVDFEQYKVNEDELISYITQLISQHPNLNTAAIMGDVMKKYRGKYPGARIMELVKKYKGE